MRPEYAHGLGLLVLPEMDLPRSARPTRGQRLTKLVDDEIEADNAFWSQDAFKEEVQDREYEQEAEQADEFDSDFDEEEPTSDEGEAQEEKELVKKKKKKLPYKKPGADKKRKSVSFLLSAAAIGRTDKSKSKKKASRPSQRAVADTGEEENVAPQEAGEGERTVRKSTRTSVVVKQAERDAIRAALQATPKPVKKKKEEEKKMSQEDMLLEAAQTEVINLQSLERMLAREEEVKKKAIIQKKVYTGPQIRFISKDGYNVLEFTKVHTFPSTINSKAKPYPERALCVVTGQPAKYKDPKTGLPYATKEAFKIIRERFVKGEKSGRKDPSEETHQRKRTKVETERVSRAGVVKVKFKRTGSGSTKDSPLATTSPASAAPSPPLQPRVQAAPPPPVQIEEVDEADFMLEDLDVNAPWTCNYETGFRAMINAGYEPEENLETQLGLANSHPGQRHPSYLR